MQKKSAFYDQEGIIKSMVRNKLFLWSRNYLNRSNGIFVVSCQDVRIQGHDIIDKEQAADYHGTRQPINSNRIMRDKLLNKRVIITTGQYKGQKGRCTHVNRDQAQVEMSIRAKKVNLPLNILVLADQKEGGDVFRGGNNNQNNYNNQGGAGENNRDMTMGGFGGENVPEDFGQTEYRGGNTQYGGGMTAYEGRTPNYLPQTPHAWNNYE